MYNIMLVCQNPFTTCSLCRVTDFMGEVSEDILLRYEEIESSIAKILYGARARLIVRLGRESRRRFPFARFQLVGQVILSSTARCLCLVPSCKVRAAFGCE